MTEKTNITTTSTEASAKMERDLRIFLEHTYKMFGQYKAINHLKENLNIQEALVHVLFGKLLLKICGRSTVFPLWK